MDENNTTRNKPKKTKTKHENNVKKIPPMYRAYSKIVRGLILAGKTPGDSYKIILTLAKLKQNEYTFQEFKNNFCFEIENSIPFATANVVTKLYETAMNGSVRAQIAWMSQFAGWGTVPEQVSPTNKNVLLLPADTTKKMWDSSAVLLEHDHTINTANEK